MNDKTNRRGSTCVATRDFRADGLSRAAGIVEALTAARKPEDRVDAFAWFEACSSIPASITEPSHVSV
jgi:hypothetical protein